jgi:multicomponent Na+:H+ antiporter subunit B
MVTLFGVFLLTLLLITAIGIVRAHNLFAAVLLTGIFSLQMAAIFFILDAADVALTEAAVGAGVATVLLLSALSLTSDEERQRQRQRWLAIAVVSATTLLVIYATFDKPRLGDPLAPVHQHVAPWYLSETPRLIDIPNVVTAILASFRGYDTLGELFVIFTAGIGVLFVLANGGDKGRLSMLPSAETEGLRHHLVPRVVARLLVPFLVLFGLYVQFHAEFGPGGGFQAGALISAGLILYALVEGESAALRALSFRVLAGMISGGAFLFVAVGIAGMLLGGNFLDYSVLLADPVAGQHLGILLVELAVGITVTGVLLTVFHAFAVREQRH